MNTSPRGLRTAVTVCVTLCFAIALPWLADAYVVSLAAYALVTALLAASAHLLTAYAGLPTLGQAAFLGVGAYAAAICANNVSTVGPLQMAAAIGAAALAATLVGFPVTHTRGVYFMLATLAVGELAYAAAEHLTSITGGGNGLSTPPVQLWPAGPGLRTEGQAYLYVLAGSALAGLGLLALLRSRVELVLRAIHDNETRVAANAVDTRRRLWAAFIIAAGVAGAAGALLVASRRYVSPTELTFDVSALALLAAIIGRRSMTAAAAGAVGIVAVRDLAGNLLVGYSPLLLGILFIAVALVSGRTRSVSSDVGTGSS